MPARAVPIVVLLLVVGIAGIPQVASASPSQCSFPVTSTDATGTEVTVEAPPDRIVALGPSAAQTLWDIDGKDQVIGMPVNEYTSYLEGSEERENVMNPDGFTVNIERVVALEPDLVLAPNIVPDETVEKLREAGLTVYKFRFAASIEDVKAKTVLTGRLTGNCEAAAERVAWMEDRLDTVREAIEDEPRPRVIYPLGGGFVAGEGTFLHQLIQTAGGRNVAAEANITGYARISIEVIVTSDPEWVILNEGLPAGAIQLYAYNHTTAGRLGQFVRVNPNYANQPAPRVVLAVETIAKTLHPDSYAAANTTAIPDTAEPPSRPETATAAGSTPAAETPGQAGFGLLIAIAALLASLSVASARR